MVHGRTGPAPAPADHDWFTDHMRALVARHQKPTLAERVRSAVILSKLRRRRG